MLTKFPVFTDFRSWSLATLTTVGLTAGFVRWLSDGWSQWARRLPMHPRCVWSAKLLWLIVLALPALLSVSWLTADSGSSWEGLVVRLVDLPGRGAPGSWVWRR